MSGAQAQRVVCCGRSLWCFGEFLIRFRLRPTRGNCCFELSHGTVLCPKVQMPPAALEILSLNDFWGPSTQSSAFTNVLPGKFRRDEDGKLLATVYQPHVPNSDYLGNTGTPWKEITQTDYEMIVAPDQRFYTKQALEDVGTALYVHRDFLASTDPLTLAMTDTTVVMNWEPRNPKMDQMLELFSGGFGGW